MTRDKRDTIADERAPLLPSNTAALSNRTLQPKAPFRVCAKIVTLTFLGLSRQIRSTRPQAINPSLRHRSPTLNHHNRCSLLR